jgi:hypothetical protein
MDRSCVEVPVGSFCSYLKDSPCGSRTVHTVIADCPPQGRGLSARAPAGQLSHLLLASCFRFGIIWGLFLGLVGPL